MKFSRFLPLLAAVVSCASAVAQSASLTSNTNVLLPAGGTIVLTASATYNGRPAAMGWSIALPSDWSLEATAGPDVPQVAPETGTTGVLEFAYTNVPAGAARFSAIVRYRAGASRVLAVPTVIVRGKGQLLTLHPPPVAFAQAVSDPHHKASDRPRRHGL